MQMAKILFSTNSNKDLAKSIAVKAKIKLGQVEISSFADQEKKIVLKDGVKGKNIYVLGSTNAPTDNLVELLILINTIKINRGKNIKVIIPYYGYGKSDHLYKTGTSLNAKLIARLLKEAGAQKIISINLHSRKVENFISNLKHLNAIPLLAQEYNKLKLEDLAIASPDQGGIIRAKYFAQEIGVKDLITIKKSHPRPDQVRVVKIKGKVKNKNIIIVDDMAQSGNTLTEAAKNLKIGGAKNIYIALVHLVSIGPAIKRLSQDKNIKMVITTNSIANKNLSKKFKVVKIDDLISKQIKD